MTANTKKRLTLADAAKALGKTEPFVLSLTLTGARRPTDQGGDVVEIDYAVDGDDVVFTPKGIEQFLRKCPVGEFVAAAAAAEALGVHRSQLTVLVYTGVQTAAGAVVRLPVWAIGGGRGRRGGGGGGVARPPPAGGPREGRPGGAPQ